MNWLSTLVEFAELWVRRLCAPCGYCRGRLVQTVSAGGRVGNICVWAWADLEQYAAYRAAWHALGRPEIDRATHELSDAQLRMRVRAWDREQAWGPRYVGHELAGTRQAATHHHQTAALRRASADVATDHADRARLHQEATRPRPSPQRSTSV